MKLPIIIIIMLIIIVVVSAAVTFAYYLIYRSLLKKRIASGLSRTSRQRRLIDPLRFFIISLLVMTLLAFIFLMFTSIRPAPEFSFKRLDDNSMISDLSYEDDISGYERHEQSDGDLKVIYYINTSDRESFPTLLVYVNSAHEYSTGITGKSVAADGVGSYDSECWYAFNGDNIDGSFTLIVTDEDSSVTLEIPIS